jgi:hypothetical protein
VGDEPDPAPVVDAEPTPPEDEPEDELEALLQKRLEAARKRWEALKAFEEAGTVNLDRLLEASERLAQAQSALASNREERIEAARENVKRLRAIAEQQSVKRDQGTGAEPDLTEAQESLLEAEIRLARLSRSDEPQVEEEPADDEAPPEAAEADAPPEEATEAPEPMDEDDPPSVDEGDAYQPGGEDARSQLILGHLAKPVALPFPNETPLQDVITYLKEESKSKELPNGLPIYVDPVGLQDAERTIQSPIQIDLEGVPLRTTLKFMLRQLDLVYAVEDGVLIISNRERMRDLLSEPPVFQMSEEERAAYRQEKDEQR